MHFIFILLKHFKVIYNMYSNISEIKYFNIMCVYLPIMKSKWNWLFEYNVSQLRYVSIENKQRKQICESQRKWSLWLQQEGICKVKM